MTLLDLTRELHAAGEEIVAVDVWTFQASEDEKTWLYAARPGGYAQYLFQTVKLPFKNIDLGPGPSDKIPYRIAHSPEEYRKLTYGRETPQRGYPRLLLPLMPTAPRDFLNTWRGKHWSEVPCRELSAMDNDGNAVPALDRKGNIDRIVYMGMEGQDTEPGYYLVYARAGRDSAVQFVWPYDLASVPKGLSVMDAPEFS